MGTGTGTGAGEWEQLAVVVGVLWHALQAHLSRTHAGHPLSILPSTASGQHAVSSVRTPLCSACPSFSTPRTPPLQEYGRIDVADARNSAAQYPSSAFSPVQVALARLEAMTDVKPACYPRFKQLYEARSTDGRWVGSDQGYSRSRVLAGHTVRVVEGWLCTVLLRGVSHREGAVQGSSRRAS